MCHSTPMCIYRHMYTATLSSLLVTWSILNGVLIEADILYTRIILADIYWAVSLTPEIITILFTNAGPAEQNH